MTPRALTRRQLEVLRVYAETGSYKETAHRLRCSADTVRATLANIRSRLEVDSTVQAVMIVFGTAA